MANGAMWGVLDSAWLSCRSIRCCLCTCMMNIIHGCTFISWSKTVFSFNSYTSIVGRMQWRLHVDMQSRATRLVAYLAKSC